MQESNVINVYGYGVAKDAVLVRVGNGKVIERSRKGFEKDVYTGSFSRDAEIHMWADNLLAKYMDERLAYGRGHYYELEDMHGSKLDIDGVKRLCNELRTQYGDGGNGAVKSGISGVYLTFDTEAGIVSYAGKGDFDNLVKRGTWKRKYYITREKGSSTCNVHAVGIEAYQIPHSKVIEQLLRGEFSDRSLIQCGDPIVDYDLMFELYGWLACGKGNITSVQQFMETDPVTVKTAINGVLLLFEPRIGVIKYCTEDLNTDINLSEYKR